MWYALGNAVKNDFSESRVVLSISAAVQLPSVSIHCVEQARSETLPATHAAAGSMDTVTLLVYIEINAKIRQLPAQCWLTSGQPGA